MKEHDHHCQHHHPHPPHDHSRRDFCRLATVSVAGAAMAAGVPASAMAASASPSAAVSPDRRKFMEEASRLATESVEKGWGGPFGAVVVKDGEIIGRGQNRVLLTGVPVYHAEITAIIDASQRLNPKPLLGAGVEDGTLLERIPRPPGSPDLVEQRARMLAGCEIYVNAAPCPMCMSAIYWRQNRPPLFCRQPRRHQQHRLQRRLPVRRFCLALGAAQRHQGNAKLRT